MTDLPQYMDFYPAEDGAGVWLVTATKHGIKREYLTNAELDLIAEAIREYEGRSSDDER